VSFSLFSGVVIPVSPGGIPSYCSQFLNLGVPQTAGSAAVDCTQRPDDRFPCTGPNCPCAGGMVDYGHGEYEKTSSPTKKPTMAPVTISTSPTVATTLSPTVGATIAAGGNQPTLDSSTEVECLQIQSEIQKVSEAETQKQNFLIGGIVSSACLFAFCVGMGFACLGCSCLSSHCLSQKKTEIPMATPATVPDLETGAVTQSPAVIVSPQSDIQPTGDDTLRVGSMVEVS